MSSITHDLRHGKSINLSRQICDHVTGCGCEGISDCCFQCPLERCRFEAVGGAKVILAEGRNKEIVRLYHTGIERPVLAEQFSLSLGTVSRVIRKDD